MCSGNEEMPFLCDTHSRHSANATNAAICCKAIGTFATSIADCHMFGQVINNKNVLANAAHILRILQRTPTPRILAILVECLRTNSVRTVKRAHMYLVVAGISCDE